MESAAASRTPSALPSGSPLEMRQLGTLPEGALLWAVLAHNIAHWEVQQRFSPYCPQPPEDLASSGKPTFSSVAVLLPARRLGQSSRSATLLIKGIDLALEGRGNVAMITIDAG